MFHKNELLSRLKKTSFEAILPHLSIAPFASGEAIAEPHERVNRAYFPHSGVLSCVVDLAGGGAVETGMIGKDGVFGGSQALDGKTSLNRVIAHMGGKASTIDAQRLCELALIHPDIREVLIKYEQLFLAQVQQTAACNAVHSVRQRLARWLLRMHTLVGPDLQVTHEFLAQMMGVRRPSVTDIARDMQGGGLISYQRGHIRIVDVVRLSQFACECEDDLEFHHDALFGSNVSEIPSLEL